MLESDYLFSLPLMESLGKLFSDPITSIGISLDILILFSLLLGRTKIRKSCIAVKAREWTKYHLAIIVLLLMSLLLAEYSVSFILLKLKVVNIDQENPAFTIIQTVVFHFITILTIYNLGRASNFNLKQSFGIQFRTFFKNILQGGTFLIAAIPLILITTILGNHFLIQAGFSPTNQEIVDLLSTNKTPFIHSYLIFTALIMAPLVEELLFRGIAIPALAKMSNTTSAVILSSLVFAMIHMNMFSFIPLFVLSISFSLAYLATGSIITTIAMHSFFNLLSILAIAQQ